MRARHTVRPALAAPLWLKLVGANAIIVVIAAVALMRTANQSEAFRHLGEFFLGALVASVALNIALVLIALRPLAGARGCRSRGVARQHGGARAGLAVGRPRHGAGGPHDQPSHGRAAAGERTIARAGGVRHSRRRNRIRRASLTSCMNRLRSGWRRR